MVGKLTARTAATTRPGRYGDGAGLWLVVSASGARKWVFRFSFGGKVTEMGLGAADAVSLAQARNRAAAARQMVAAGKNPIVEKREAKRIEAGKPTFGAMADELIAAKSAEWRNEKHRYQWKMTLEIYAVPLRERPVDEIDTEAVLGVLQPIWLEKSETASRLRGRIEAVLDAARAKGHISRHEANPARWRGHLDKLLAKPKKLSRGHQAAMAYEEIAAFLARLRERDAATALALELTILTCLRTTEALGAQWVEIDFAEKVWTVPALRMKGKEAHRVPLSDRAIEILKTLSEAKTGTLVFPGQKEGKPLSQMSMLMLLRRMGLEIGKATTHGFRSSFRDWAGDCTAFPREIVEAALAHKIGNSVEQAYRRSDALEKRRPLMTAWATYCEPKRTSNVVQLAPARS